MFFLLFLSFIIQIINSRTSVLIHLFTYTIFTPLTFCPLWHFDSILVLISFRLFYSLFRCTPPNKSTDYQKIYSDWCNEFEKYKSAMKSWEKKQVVCVLYFNCSCFHDIFIIYIVFLFALRTCFELKMYLFNSVLQQCSARQNYSNQHPNDIITGNSNV